MSGGAIALFAIVAPLAVWVHRRRRSAKVAEAAFTRSGLLLMSGFVVLLVLGAVGVQLIPGVAWKLAAAAGYLTVLVAVFGAVGDAMAKSGRPMYRKPPNQRLERSRHG
jgi:biotin transporter BioY